MSIQLRHGKFRWNLQQHNSKVVWYFIFSTTIFCIAHSCNLIIGYLLVIPPLYHKAYHIINTLKTVCVITVYLNGKLIRNKTLFMGNDGMFLFPFYIWKVILPSFFRYSEDVVVIFILYVTCGYYNSATGCNYTWKEKLFLDINFNVISHGLCNTMDVRKGTFPRQFVLLQDHLRDLVIIRNKEHITRKVFVNIIVIAWDKDILYFVLFIC